MIAKTTHWESELLKKALFSGPLPVETPNTAADDIYLEQAFEVCAGITKQHSHTFYLTSGLLKGNARDAARALYAFCRISDDIVDENTEGREESLQDWRYRSLKETPPETDSVPFAWAHTRAMYNIPRRYAEQLLDGVAMDLTKTRYNDFTELTHYCYGVASTVGLMTMHIIGYESEAAIPYAIKLGVALQLSNILRDVGEDWRNGRVYLPQDELAAFGLSDADIAAGIVDDRWRSFMRFQINRARQLYHEAMPGIAMLGSRGQFAIAASADLYQGILEAIEENDYDVFNIRAHLSGREKLGRLPGIWQKVFQLRRKHGKA